jgi:hypothetical protein
MPLTTTTYENLTHSDTILYEINMLRHAAAKLNEHNWENERDAWVHLESFLLHYRNLIEFFGKKDRRNTDLHITTIWELLKIEAPTNLHTIYNDGIVLYERYEPSDKAGGGRISQFLSHCTQKRTDPKSWDVNPMMHDIDPLIDAVEPLLKAKGTPEFQNVVAVPVARHYSRFASSTQVGTNTAKIDASTTVSWSTLKIE